VDPDNADSTVIVKIFLTALNQFSNRKDYFNGDPRYHRTTFGRGNKREVISKWCEKEYRNLIRAFKVGIRVPCPLLLSQHILVMQLIGVNHVPAAQLHEYESLRHSASNDETLCKKLFVEIIAAMYMLYHHAELVHGDLSPYNILICDDEKIEEGRPTRGTSNVHAFIIDFGQAVHRSHPSALEWLKRDIGSVVRFFDNSNKGGDAKLAPKCSILRSIDEIMELITAPIDTTLEEKMITVNGVELVVGSDSDEPQYEWISRFGPRNYNKHRSNCHQSKRDKKVNVPLPSREYIEEIFAQVLFCSHIQTL